MEAQLSGAGRTEMLSTDLGVLRAEVFDRILVLTVVVSILVAVLLGADAWEQATAIFVGGGLSCWWGYVWRWRKPRLAAIGFTIGCFGMVSIVTASAPASSAPAFYTIVVCAVAALLGARPAVLAAVAASLVILVVFVARGVLTFAGALPLLGLIGLVAAIAGLALWPMQTVLEWYWESHQQAMAQMAELREQRGLLQRTVKSLHDAYERLEQVNWELARAREAAVEARQRKADFIINLSHELRTPLNVILGFSRMMLREQHAYGIPLPAAYQQDAAAIVRNAEHLLALINDILDLSQIEAGRMALQKTRVPLADVIAEAVSAVASLYQQKGLAISVELPPDLPDGYFDRTRVRQILINLLSNAVRFTDQGGVTIRATVRGKDLVLSVRDTGIGIRPEDQPYIWDAFRQFGPEERRHGGSGMGLTISKLFAELHGGNMWVESSPGQGATFYISLPQSDLIEVIPVPVAGRASIPIGQPRDQGLIVVMSDDPATVRLFERYLDNFRVVAAQTVGRACRYARIGHARAIVVIGPDPETTEALRAAVLRQAGGRLVLACTLPAVRHDVDDLGVTALLPKPITREQLAEVLHRLGPQVRRVLVVDDDPDTVRLLGRLIRSVSRRYQVISALGGAEALTILQHEHPDAMILDLVMPDIDGYRVLSAVRSSTRSMPIVAISGQTLGDGDVRVPTLSVSRADGLTVRETMDCLNHALNVAEPSDVAADARSLSAAPPR